MTRGGTVLLSLIHPVYSAQYPLARGDAFPEDEEWRVRYLDRSARAYVQPWLEYSDQYEDRLSRSFHHLLSDYLNAIAAAGLTLRRTEEPLPPEGWKREFPERYEGYPETPVYLLLKLTQ